MARLPEITNRETLPEQHREVYDYLVKTRGSVRGSFAVLLNSPDVTGRVAHLGTYVRFESPLPAKVRELAALTISAELENPIEIAAHSRGARENGVNDSVISALIDRVPVDGLSSEDSLPIRCAREIIREHRIPDALFEEARKQLGEAGAVDLFAAIGYYAMLAVLHNALDLKPRE